MTDYPMTQRQWAMTSAGGEAALNPIIDDEELFEQFKQTHDEMDTAALKASLEIQAAYYDYICSFIDSLRGLA